MRVIHPLWMPYFSEGNKFIVDNLAKNTCNKTRNHVIVGEKASEIFKLVVSVEAGLEHELRQKITHFNRRKAFRSILLHRKKQRIHADHWDLLYIPLLNTAFQWSGIGRYCKVLKTHIFPLYWLPYWKTTPPRWQHLVFEHLYDVMRTDTICSFILHKFKLLPVVPVYVSV